MATFMQASMTGDAPAPRLALARELGNPLHHLIDAEPAGIELDRVGSGLQRAVLARAVALIAHRLLGEHGVEVGAELRGASACALARIRGEEDLQRGVGRDDCADVASLGDPVSLSDQAVLLGL